MRSLAREILGADGPLARRLGTDGGFEVRAEQLEMAAGVEAALGARARLLVEAGTGVGKSFAYLVPAMLRCATTAERVVVATNTIALQEQLVAKDIPFLQETFPEWLPDGAERREVTPALVKGRGNYVSVRRLRMASERQDRLFPDAASRRALHVIEDWAYETDDGTLSTLPVLDRPAVWDRVQSDSDNCMGRACPTYDRCFYQRARRRMEAANLLVCNHAVFFADLALRAGGSSPGGGEGHGFLGRYDHVILDEAHSIEDVACEHFGLSLTRGRVDHLLAVLYHPRSGRGYLPQLGTLAVDTGVLDSAHRAVIDAGARADDFFDELRALAVSGRLRNGRVPAPGAVADVLAPAMDRLALALAILRDHTTSEPDRFELAAYIQRATDIATQARALVAQSLPGCVYWIEGGDDDADPPAHGRPRGQPARVRLACAPVEVAPLLRQHLFARELGIVLTSATLATGARPPAKAAGAPHAAQDGDRRRVVPVDEHGAETDSAPARTPGRGSAKDRDPFAHARTRLGCDVADTLVLGSPFDHSAQVELIIDRTVPAPPGGRASGGAAATYLDALARAIRHHVEATEGGAFVLCTSFATLRACADRLRAPLARLGLPLLAQGVDGTPGQILRAFRADERSVLLGAASFWQGVDVRGRALRNVIITRLPFEPPDRPLTEARLDLIRSRGGNPFLEDSLPRAILRFKQGFGRLIRARTDSGRVVLLDPRVTASWYGRAFLDALPHGVRVVTRGPDHDERPGWEAGLDDT